MLAHLVRANRALILVFAGLFLISAPFLKTGQAVTNKSCSPAEIAYDAFAPYCVGTVKTKYALKTTCAVRIVRQTDDIATGYGTEEEYINAKLCEEGAVKPEWNMDGLRLTFPGGTKDFPAASFTGGR